MSGLVHDLSKQCVSMFIKTQVDLFSEDFIRGGSLQGLLTEALNDEDKGEMDEGVQAFLGALDDLGSSLPDTPEWQAVIQAIEAASKVDFSALYDEKSDPKKRADAAADLTTKIQDVCGEMAAVVQCVEAVKGEISGAKPEDPTQTIGDLANAAGEGGDDAPEFPTVEDIEKAVEKTYVVPDWFNKAWETGSKAAEAEGGGFFDKVMGFISKLFGGDDSGNLVEDEVILAAILSSPFEEFTAVNLQGVQTALVGSTEQIATETSETSAAAAAAQQGQKMAAAAPDMKAAQAGAEALAQDADTAKEVSAAVKGSLEPADAAAFDSALQGKLDSLTARQQAMAAKILQMFQSGPDGSTPEQVAEIAPEAVDAADEEIASNFKNLDALADLGDKHLGDAGGELVKNLLSDEEASKLFVAHWERKRPLLHENSLTSLLFEQEEEGIPFEDVLNAFVTIGKTTGAAPDEKGVTAWATDVNDQELLDKKIAVAGEEGADGEEGAPVSEEEAAEEQELAQTELETAAKEAASQEQPPAVAVAAALDNWMGGLSDTSQKSLQAKDRIGGLKDLVNTALEDAAKAIEGEVQAAIDMWRGEHEETLTKSKRFAKKNFDSLSELIPQIAAQMLKVTAESNVRLTRGMVRKSVHRYLDRRFGQQGVLIESARWEVLAGIRRR